MEEPPNGPVILQPGEGRSIDLGNFSMTVLADADSSATKAPETPDAGFGSSDGPTPA